MSLFKLLSTAVLILFVFFPTSAKGNQKFYVEILILQIKLNNNNTAGSDQRRLLQKLFTNYNPLERPSLNETQNLKVELGLSIQQIVDIVNIIVFYLSGN